MSNYAKSADCATGIAYRNLARQRLATIPSLQIHYAVLAAPEIEQGEGGAEPLDSLLSAISEIA